MGCPEEFEIITGKKLPSITSFILESGVTFVNAIIKISCCLPVITIKKRKKELIPHVKNKR